MLKRAICVTALELAGLGGGAETAAAAGDKQKAQRLLTGLRLTGYINGSWTDATIDRSVDLCRGGRFFYESNVTSSVGSNRQTARGGWRVGAARVDRRFGWARLRFVTEEGLRGQVRVAAGSRGTTVNGYPVETGRNPIC
jgi:hypothetical protein